MVEARPDLPPRMRLARLDVPVMHPHCGLTPNPSTSSHPPQARGDFGGRAVSPTEGQWVQPLLKGRLAMPRGWCWPSVPASASSRLLLASSSGAGDEDTSSSCCLLGEKQPLVGSLVPCRATPSRQGHGDGDIAHLELILMPVVDLRARATMWLSSASTDWSTPAFTTYWLLLVGCHWTPKIWKKGRSKRAHLFPGVGEGSPW